MLVFQSSRLTVIAKHLITNNGTLTFQRRIPKDLLRFYKNGQQFIRHKLTGKYISIESELAYHTKQTDKLFNELRSHDPQKLLALEAEAFLAMFGNKPNDGNIMLENLTAWNDSEIGFHPQAHLADLEAEIESLKSTGKFEEKHKLAVHLLKKSEEKKQFRNYFAALGLRQCERYELIESYSLITNLNQLVDARDSEINNLNQLVDARDSEISEILSSTSWNVSFPIRYFGKWFKRACIIGEALFFVVKRPLDWTRYFKKAYYVWKCDGIVGLKVGMLKLLNASTVTSQLTDAWNEYRLKFDETILPKLIESQSLASWQPLISILMPTYNTNANFLTEAILSVKDQGYKNWELCIVDDASTMPHVRKIISDFSKADSRIKTHYSTENMGVSYVTNKALEMASGDFVLLLDHDDILEKQALLRVAESVINDDPDFLYSDEILMSEDGYDVKHIAYRPAFSPEFIRSNPYIVHLVGFKTKVLRDVGGLNENLKISQDYDLILRVIEVAKVIVHIPEVLYRWRIHNASSGHKMSEHVMNVSKSILRNHLQRSELFGLVNDGPAFNLFSINYSREEGSKVAIIIPTKDGLNLLKACVNSIKKTTAADKFDLYIIDHESKDLETLAYLNEISNTNGINVLKFKGEFNFSKINNWAVSKIHKPYTHILFCNNDIEAIKNGWLEQMLLISQQSQVGVVGPMLMYGDTHTIQHAGVCVGINGLAEHYGKFHKLSKSHLDAGYMGAYLLTREVSAVTAACLLIKKEVFDELSGFDESIKVGFGDVDLCLRVISKGYSVLFSPLISLIHHESQTRGVSYIDNHPQDTALFKEKWEETLSKGDFFYNTGLSLNSTLWDYKLPIPLIKDITRRVCTKSLFNNKINYKYSYSV